MEPALFDTHDALEERHWWFVARRRILSSLIDRLMANQHGGLIVDLGCGTGGMVAHLSQSYRCLGLDASAQAIAMARRKCPACEFQEGDVPALARAKAGEAALYLLMDVLEHIDDDKAFLSEVVAGAKPGAAFLITVPANMALWSVHDETAHHKRRYDWQGFNRLWDGLPVSLRLQSHFNSRLFPVIYLIRQLGRLTGRSFGQGGSDFALPSPLVNRLLTEIFAGEGKRLLGLLGGTETSPYRQGASLLAVLVKS